MKQPRQQAISIVASHGDKEPFGMLAFVNGALQGLIAFGDLPDTARIVISELVQQINEFIGRQPKCSEQDKNL